MTDMRAVVLSGQGRYGDPWHPFDQTSACLARLVRTAGLRVEVREALASDCLSGLGSVDLLVVNTGTGMSPEQPIDADPGWQQAFSGLGEWLDGGGRLLACHTAVASLRDWAEWPQRLGGEWVRGRSGHPPLGVAGFQPVAGAAGHPFFDGLTGTPTVTVVDEKYSDLRLHPGAQPVLAHQSGGDLQVMGWTVAANVVYDGMGHDAHSYESPTRCRYLANELRWLLNS